MLINNLPQLSQKQKLYRETMCSKKHDEPFTVNRIPFVENFDTLPSTLYKSSLKKDKFSTEKNEVKKLNLFIDTSFKPIVNVLSDSEDNDELLINSTTLPKINRVTSNDKKKGKHFIFHDIMPNKITSIYIGALTIVGLFILFRTIKK